MGIVNRATNRTCILAVSLAAMLVLVLMITIIHQYVLQVMRRWDVSSLREAF